MSTPAKKPKSSASRVAAYRQRMRASGLVPKIIWVPDTKDPRFVEEYRRQAKVIASDLDSERELMAFFEEAYADFDLGGIPEYRIPDDK
jgi:hypothetical protein